MDKLTVLDMFAGCGGFSQGFIQAGYEVLLGIDNNETALKTFRHNHTGIKGLNIDLFSNDFLNTTDNNLNKEIDVIIGGPPCQGFSLTGKRDKDDERNKLYLSVYKTVKHYMPKAFIIENVPGIATMYKGKAKQHIEELFTEIGYTVNFDILLAADYGVPQIRKRAFFVGLTSTKFEFPNKLYEKENYISCEQAISDLPSLIDNKWDEIQNYATSPLSIYQKLLRRNSKKVLNHIGTIHSNHVIEVIKQVPEGGNHKDLPPGVGESRKFNEAWTRYHSQKPSKTIDTGHRNHFHYKYNRVPTVRENARLQSFPDTFEFLGTKTEQYRQVGNAVPPILAQALAEQLLNYIEKDAYNQKAI